MFTKYEFEKYMKRNAQIGFQQYIYTVQTYSKKRAINMSPWHWQPIIVLPNKNNHVGTHHQNKISFLLYVFNFVAFV